MVEERLLILRFKRGSPQALRRIYDKYKVEMLKLATSVVDRVRNQRRNNHRHGAISLEDASLPPSGGPGPAQWAILSEELALLAEAMQQLPYEQREVICLRMEMDMSFRRIAAVQRVPLNTAKGRYRYGMERLRSLLESEVRQCDPQTM